MTDRDQHQAAQTPPAFNADAFTGTLRRIAGILDSAPVVWCLGASGALYVQGVAVEPGDLDIIIDSKDFKKARTALGPLSPGNIRTGMLEGRTFDRYPLENTAFPAEVAGFDIAADKLIIEARWEGMLIPVHPLDVELEGYRRRPDKAHVVARIEQALRGTPLL